MRPLGSQGGKSVQEEEKKKDTSMNSKDNHESQLCIRNLKSGTNLNIPRIAISYIFCIYLAQKSR